MKHYVCYADVLWLVRKTRQVAWSVPLWNWWNFAIYLA